MKALFWDGVKQWLKNITGSDVVNTPKGSITATNMQDVVNGLSDRINAVGGGGLLVGTPDNIVNGLTVTTGAGLQASIAMGRAIINETVVNYDISNTITLSPRMVSLIYAKTGGTIGKVDAKYPTDLIDNNTVCFWIPNKTGNIPNLAVGKSSIAVANDLIPHGGLKKVDGWCDYSIQGDGNTGYYTGSNLIGIPVGATERHISIHFTANELGSPMFYYGTTAPNQDFFIFTDANGAVTLNTYGTNYASNFIIEMGKTYLLDFLFNGTTAYFYISGNLVASMPCVLNTAGGGLSIGKSSTAYLKQTIHFIEIRNKMRTPVQIAQISNKLLLPCAHDGKDIREILPADSTTLGIIATSSTEVKEIRDDYRDGRVEGATGGNRILNTDEIGWKSSTGAVSFDNTFGVVNLRVDVYLKTSTIPIKISKVPSAVVEITQSKINISATGNGLISIIVEVIE